MKTTLITILVLLVTAGCSKGQTQAEVSNGFGSADVKLVELKDGTKCAVMIGARKGGIDCDWSSKK